MGKSSMRIKQSESVEIKRSQIIFAKYNPRKKSEKVVKELIKNFKTKGFLGGVVWNETSGNLISGHKRVEALDIINKFDGTKETEYFIRVEKCTLTEQEEKEQNIFMNSKDVQGEYDFEILSEMLPDIDIQAAGISFETEELILAEFPNFEFSNNKEIKDDFKKLSDTNLSKEQLTEERRKKKEERKIIKQNFGEKAMEKPYMIITFKDFETKAFVCEHFKINPYAKYIGGEIIFKDILQL